MTIKFMGELKSFENYTNNGYIDVPFDVKDTFGKARVKVKIWYDDILYRGSLAKMNGKYFFLIRKDIFAQLRKDYGEMVEVRVEEDTDERTVEIPKTMEQKLRNDGLLTQFLAKSFTFRKEAVIGYNEAKKEETKERRYQKMIQNLKN